MTQAVKNGAYVNPGIGIPALCAQFQPADLAIPGAFRVSQFGDLANWRLGVKGVPAVGGAMDLILTKDGKPKLVEQCTLSSNRRNSARGRGSSRSCRTGV